jgi:hypothetical protein
VIVGMGWYSKSISPEALQQAVEHYTKKYGAEPDTVHVHPSASELLVGKTKLRVVGDGRVIKLNLWIGVDDDL